MGLYAVAFLDPTSGRDGAARVAVPVPATNCRRDWVHARRAICSGGWRR